MSSFLAGLVRHESWNRPRRFLKGNDAAGRAAAGYSSLLVQRRVTRRKHAPEPPTTPALLTEGGARPTAHPCAAGSLAPPARTALTRGSSRLRLRCSAAATGPDVNGKIKTPASGFRSRWSSPSTAARPGEFASRCSSPKRVVQRSASSARARPREERREPHAVRRATGCAFFWFLFFAQAKKRNPHAAREPHQFISPQAIRP